MVLRFFWPGIVVYILLMLVLLLPSHWNVTSTQKSIVNTGLFYVIGFAVLAHVWLTAIKKQRKYKKISRFAVELILTCVVLSGIFVELFQGWTSEQFSFHWINIFYCFLGGVMGIGTFRLVYSRCY